MKLFSFAGSLRLGSYNKMFAREALRLALESGVEGEFADMRDYRMPPYDADLETSSGIPESTRKLGQKIRTADALIIATPENNGSISGTLKNIVDWLSREQPVSLRGKHLLLLAASTGALGGVRGLWHARVPFEVLGMHVFPDMKGLPNAANAFNELGRLRDEQTLSQVKATVTAFVAHAAKG
jgi:NAD(P)H-dependent FMN reductase